MTQTLDFDGGREVTAYVPARPPEYIVFSGDGQLLPQWGADLERPDLPSTMMVGVHRVANEALRLHEYSPAFDAARFDAHAAFLVNDVRHWTASRFGASLPPERTAVLGVSAGGELALALGLAHPDVFGAVFCASPGAGYRPPVALSHSLPRVYLVAGTREPFFRDNAERWATALRDAGADVALTTREGSHGDEFWRKELPLMLSWAWKT